ncbi:hypothetical protein [Sphingomonas sp. LHG3443-2]|uniref:hypothetical protein n=1 Tax=Sphingomonas sp. LHG3443-2 TaxID=2804639 RepID=UPI003CF6B338
MGRLPLALLFLSTFCLAGCGQRQGYTTVEVGNTTYDFATRDLTVSYPGALSPYVLLHPGSVKDPATFVLNYELREQDERWPSGVPRIAWVTFRDTKPQDVLMRRFGDHQIVCEKTKIELGLRYSCGIAFFERETRWTVRFGTRWMREPEKVLAQAIDLLRQSQRWPRP